MKEENKEDTMNEEEYKMTDVKDIRTNNRIVPFFAFYIIFICIFVNANSFLCAA